jgi:hypothetical protein
VNAFVETVPLNGGERRIAGGLQSHCVNQVCTGRVWGWLAAGQQVVDGRLT